MTINCFLLTDSTAHGLKLTPDKSAAEIVVDSEREVINLVSPGSTLCVEGKETCQPSLTSLLANPERSSSSSDAIWTLKALLDENRPVH